MRTKTRSQVLTDIVARIMKAWGNDVDPRFVGIRMDAPKNEWRGGYGIPIDDNKPDFVKKDDIGWDSLGRSENL